VTDAVRGVDAALARTKVSKEKTMPGQMLYSPVALNAAFEAQLYPKGWKNLKVDCDYPTEHYLEDYEHRVTIKGAFRDMDFVKDKLGVEVQFGKYSFMVYNVCAKMTIFHNLGHIDCGIEIVPVKALAVEMSSGVSYFEQFVWDSAAPAGWRRPRAASGARSRSTRRARRRACSSRARSAGGSARAR
jgi:hypothetical protein